MPKKRDEMKECPACNGTGREDGRGLEAHGVCSTCHGTGRVPA
jgi:DnaJ-class molecular chaperone